MTDVVGTESLAQEPAPPAEVEAPEIEAEQPVNLDAPEDEPEQIDPVDDDEEIDWNGKKFKAPKGVKASILMQADYTRKTQEVASERQALKAEREALVQQAEAQRASLADHAQLHSITEQLKQYENVDWQSFINNDPIEAQKHQANLSMLERQRHALASKIQNAETERTLKAQQETAKRMEEAAREVSKIPGWGPELQSQLREFAKTAYGYSDEDIQKVDARTVKLLHAAFVGQKALSKVKPAQQQPAITPLTTVTPRSSPGARKSLSDMTMEEYAAARKAGRTS